MKKKNILIFFGVCFVFIVFAQKTEFVPNYDENKVPVFDLPQLLQSNNNESINSFDLWIKNRKPEILNFFTDSVFGAIPEVSYNFSYKLISLDTSALKNKAIKKEIDIYIVKKDTLTISLLLYIPKNVSKAPVFLGLNFFGNQTISDDTTVRITQSWVENRSAFGIDNNKATRASIGVRKNRWPVDTIISHGYALATVHYADIFPDYQGMNKGIIALFEDSGKNRSSNDWGTIAAWSFGLMRVVDYLVADSMIDNEKISVVGHSRLGKAALWAGVQDERIALVVSNNSGCSGAALSKREFGETIWRINNNFPHWFCDNYKFFNHNEKALKYDQHMLLALIAPRKLYVASAQEDLWADPRGEYLSLYHASEVYKLINLHTVLPFEMPTIHQPIISGNIGYHIREGKHDVVLYDWQQFLKFANKQFNDTK
jgi:hypothetical protein